MCSSLCSTACTFLGDRQTEYVPFCCSKLLQIVSIAGQYFLSWLWHPHQKQGRPFLEGSFKYPSFRLRASWLFECGLLFVLRGWLTDVVNFALSFYPTDNGSICFLASACRLMQG